MTRSACPFPVRRGHTRPAFTLAELIVATIILAMVLGATTLAVVQALRSRDRATAAGEAFSRATLAAGRIAADAQGALRDADLNFAKVSFTRGGPAGKAAQGLLLFTHLNRPVRTGPDFPESDEFELQYRLEPGPSSADRNAPALFTLWRRADPVPDDYYDAGGVAAPVVDGLLTLNLDAYDGSAWRTEWDSDTDGLPHAIRISVTASDDAGKRTATARRTVAFDRAPAPLPEEEDETTEETDQAAGGDE